MTAIVLILSVSAILIMMYVLEQGRVRNLTELAGAIALTVGAGLWLMRSDAEADTRIKTTVENLFKLQPETEFLTFKRASSAGDPVTQIEAIVGFTPEGFQTYRQTYTSLAPMEKVSFKYPGPGPFEDLTIDKFNVGPEALIWNDLPRSYKGPDSFHPKRGHYSRVRTPDERDMSGQYLCAVVAINYENKSASTDIYDVISCAQAEIEQRFGIVILAFLNAEDQTLHIKIK